MCNTVKVVHYKAIVKIIHNRYNSSKLVCREVGCWEVGCRDFVRHPSICYMTGAFIKSFDLTLQN